MNAKQLRYDIFNRLDAAVSSATVNLTPTDPDNIGELPTLGIFIAARSADTQIPVSPIMTINFEVEIDVAVGHYTTAADDLDDILEEVKAALFSDTDFVNAHMFVSGYSEDITLHNEGETHIAVGILRFTVSDIQHF